MSEPGVSRGCHENGIASRQKAVFNSGRVILRRPLCRKVLPSSCCTIRFVD